METLDVIDASTGEVYTSISITDEEHDALIDNSDWDRKLCSYKENTKNVMIWSQQTQSWNLWINWPEYKSNDILRA